MNKLRVDGETISSDRTYSGKRVIQLLNIAFENGVRRGTIDADKDMSAKINSAYTNGYKEGYEKASADLIELKRLLTRIINF